MRPQAACIGSLIVCITLTIPRTSSAQDDLGLGTELQAGASTFDLASGPAWLDVLRSLGLSFRDSSVEGRAGAEFAQLNRIMSQAMSSSDLGFLIRVNVYRDVNGASEVPGGHVLLPVGAGTSPIAALADAKRLGYMAPQPGPGLTSSVAHLWVRRDATGKLKTTIIPREGTAALESAASTEAQNLIRANIPILNRSAVQKSIDRASFWQRFEQQRLADVSDQKRREELQALTQRMLTLETEINRLAQEYQNTEREMARHAARASFLEGVATIHDIVSKAIQVGGLLGASGAPLKASPGPVYDKTIEARVALQRVVETKNHLVVIDKSLTIYRKDANDTEEALRKKYGEAKIDAPR